LLPHGLIKARIARGFSQKELADKLGLKEQQIQRYEASDYETASFARLKEIVSALEINVNEDIFLSGSTYTTSTLFKNLSNWGISKDFVLSKLLSNKLASKFERISEMAEQEAQMVISTIAAVISRVFDIKMQDLFDPRKLTLQLNSNNTPRYKKAKNANENKVTAYTIYAQLLAFSVLRSISLKQQMPLPEDPFKVREAIIFKYGKINFENVIRYIWSLGIPVIALNDPGAFHGACWRIDGLNVIALKQKTMSEARWINDALHELCHTGQHLENPTLNIIENEIISAKDLEDEDELDAIYFAAEVFLGEQIDKVAEECIKDSKGNMSNLKNSVEK
jgi:transcriptional regulator with XRE-family HTH domain